MTDILVGTAATSGGVVINSPPVESGDPTTGLVVLWHGTRHNEGSPATFAASTITP
jgi:hypothetical protein